MIDVRSRAEFEKGHASCAHRLHFETNEAARAKDAQLVDNLEMLTNGDKDFPVQVYGQSEARAGMVQNFLKGHHGYSHITNAKGWTNRQDEIEALCQCYYYKEGNTTNRNLFPYYTIPPDYSERKEVSSSNHVISNWMIDLTCLLVLNQMLSTL